MKVLYLALAGGSTDHDNHKYSQIQSWANNLNPNHKVIWIHGDPTVKEAFRNGNDLFLPVMECYENLLAKTVLATKWVLENIEFDYLVRTNTSNYFYFPLVEQYLGRYAHKSLSAGGVIAGGRGTICGEKRNHTYISGAGIFLSHEAAKCLEVMKTNKYEGVPDDVAIGHWLRECDVDLYSIPRNDVTDYRRIKPSPQTRVKSWNHPQFTVERMLQIDEVYSSTNRDDLTTSLRKFLTFELRRAKIERRKSSMIYKTVSCLSYPFLVLLFSRALSHGKNSNQSAQSHDIK